MNQPLLLFVGACARVVDENLEESRGSRARSEPIRGPAPFG
jgi:hypothetical protein